MRNLRCTNEEYRVLTRVLIQLTAQYSYVGEHWRESASLHARVVLERLVDKLRPQVVEGKAVAGVVVANAMAQRKPKSDGSM